LQSRGSSTTCCHRTQFTSTLPGKKLSVSTTGSAPPGPHSPGDRHRIEMPRRITDSRLSSLLLRRSRAGACAILARRPTTNPGWRQSSTCLPSVWQQADRASSRRSDACGESRVRRHTICFEDVTGLSARSGGCRTEVLSFFTGGLGDVRRIFQSPGGKGTDSLGMRWGFSGS